MTTAITTPTKLNPRVNARLAAYTTLAGVVLASPALAPETKAAIIFSGTIINVPTTSAGVYLNVVTGVSAITPAGAPGWDLNLWGTSTLFTYANNGASPNDGVIQNYTGGTSATAADNLPVGTPVNGTYSFGRTDATETTGATAFNLNSSANYIGFRFLNESTGQIDYGWAELSLSSAYNSQPRSIIGYAYDNTGAAINVGAVPEPATTVLLGAMAAGAVGVRRWRRQRPTV